MKHRPPPVKTFKDNLKQLFFVYSLIPVLGLLALVGIVLLTAGGLLIGGKNRETAQKIGGVMEQTFAKYEELLYTLCGRPGIVDPMTSLTKRQQIVRLLYQASVDSGYGAQLYIVDAEQNVCVSTEEEVFGSLESEAEKKWKILLRLEKAAEDTVCWHVNPMGSQKRLYIGKNVFENGERKGSVVLSIDAGRFSELLSGHTQRNLLVDETGWVFASDSYNFMDAVGRLGSKIPEKNGFFLYDGAYCYLTRTPVGEGILTVYTITDFTDSMTVLAAVSLSGVLVLLAVFLFAFANAERLAQTSTADISRMNEALNEVQRGNLNAYLDIKSSVEFANIGACYNGMLDSLKRQIAANKELAETVAYAQVKQLESQFNFHFLFNTLDNIRFMCRIDADMAEFMTVSLSKLLRYSMSNANETVTVEEDLKYIGMYLDIIRVRYGERFDYMIQLPEELLECAMPKLLLQPMIENSIKYGFGNREHLSLCVKGLVEGERLVFVCEDDGEGIAAEALKRLCHSLTLSVNESRHLGLYNVHRRLKLLYGEEYGIRVESENGVRVTVFLPCVRSASEERGEMRT
ncbi:MAG: histidine kinase [Lachnospiraceae bacterium]|nr:histidine kinase [Lachnospiraceae bacterium]